MSWLTSGLGQWGQDVGTFVDKTSPEWWKDIFGDSQNRYHEHLARSAFMGPLAYGGDYEASRADGNSADTALKDTGRNLGTSAAILAAIYGGAGAYGAYGAGAAGSGAGGSFGSVGGGTATGGLMGGSTPITFGGGGATFGGGAPSIASGTGGGLSLGSTLGPNASAMAGGGMPMSALGGGGGLGDMMQNLGQGQSASAGQAPRVPEEDKIDLSRPSGSYQSPSRGGSLYQFRPVISVGSNRGAFMGESGWR